MPPINTFRKAILAGAVAFCGVLGGALTDGSVTASEWMTVAATTLTAAFGVYEIRNEDNTVESDYASKHLEP